MTATVQAISAERALAIADASQRAASDPAASSWASANAGTGKTKVLTDRVLRLLLGGTPPQRILCLTFTRAAAAEMANRITGRLARWATADDTALTGDLVALTGDADADAHERAAVARRLFATVLDTPGGLKIQTIHAFCQAVLKRFPLEARLPPHFTVLDERDAAELLQDARNAVLGRAHGAGAEAELAGALAGVSAFAGETGFTDLVGDLVAKRGRLRGVIEASGGLAGTNDTVYRQLDVAPDDTEARVLADAAADGAFDGEALRRVARAMLDGGATDRRHGQIIADWLAEPAGRAAGFDAYLAVFFTGTGERRKRLIHQEALRHAPEGAAVLEAEAARLHAVRERLKAVTVARASTALLRVGAAILDAYEAAKNRRALLDYDDLIDKTRRLLTERDAAPWVLFKLDGGLDHLLIDEAQDTSPPQWRLIEALTEEFFAGEGADRAAGPPPDGRTVFAVGDHKQSIFSIQGADPDWFDRVGERFSERVTTAGRTWRPVDLQVSFRSTEAVLGTVDLVFGQPPAAAGVVSPGHAIAHLSERAGQLGVVEVWPTVRPAEAEEPQPWALPEVEDAPPPPRLRLARHIADTVAGWIRDRTPLVWERSEDGPHLRPLRAGDVMILVRRRGGFVEEMVAALKHRGVPVAGVDRMTLTEQLAVEDLVALGGFLLLPEDDLTLAEVLKGPLIGLSEDDLFELAYDRKDRSLWRRLGDAAGRAARFAAAHDALARLLARADFVPPYELFAELLEAGGGRLKLLSRLGPDAADPIDEFLGLALAYQRTHPPSLQGFLHWLKAGETQIKRDLDQGEGVVRVMTVHGAKGLQAPIVFLPDTTTLPPALPARPLWPEEDAVPPLWAPARGDEEAVTGALRAAAERRRDEEYRRLLYVAMTRAADRLYVCGWETRNRPPDGCWYNLVCAALGEAAEPVEFDFGGGWSGPGWRLEKGRGRMPADAGPAPERRPAPLPPWATTPAEPEPEPPTPLAPSRPAAEEPPVRSPFQDDDDARFRRGRLIHRLLQSLPETEPDAREAAARRFLAQPAHGLAPAQAEEIAAETLAVLAHPDFAALFGPGSLAEVPLGGLVPGADGAGRVVSGQVDRLLVTAKAVLVVDYKTNRPPPAAAAGIPEIYLRQMASYRAVLAGIYPDRPVRCALLWTDGPRLMEIPQKALERYALA